MTAWKPKPRPDWRGWIVHAVIGFALPVIAGRRGGYSACAWACVGACAFWGAWELATPMLAPAMGWDHRYADLMGFAAGVTGAVVGAMAWVGSRTWEERE